MPRGTGHPGSAPERPPPGEPRRTPAPPAPELKARPPVAGRPVPPAAAPVELAAEVRERIHLEILRRTGAYRTDDHFLLPSGHHAPEFIDKALVTTEPSFTEGLGDVIAKHFAPWPVDVVLSTGAGALILAHCVARLLPSRPTLVYATKGVSGPERRVRLPDEFTRFIRKGSKVLVVEDLITTGETIKLLMGLVTEAHGTVVGVGCLWQRASKTSLTGEVFSLVRRDFPTYDPATCPLCARGIPLNGEFARAVPPTEELVEAPRSRRRS